MSIYHNNERRIIQKIALMASVKAAWRNRTWDITLCWPRPHPCSPLHWAAPGHWSSAGLGAAPGPVWPVAAPQTGLQGEPWCCCTAEGSAQRGNRTGPPCQSEHRPASECPSTGLTGAHAVLPRGVKHTTSVTRGCVSVCVLLAVWKYLVFTLGCQNTWWCEVSIFFAVLCSVCHEPQSICILCSIPPQLETCMVVYVYVHVFMYTCASIPVCLCLCGVNSYLLTNLPRLEQIETNCNEGPCN